MSDLPLPSIRKVRICPEHACRIFAAERLYERAVEGEFRLQIDRRPRIPPKIDYKGQECIVNEEQYGIDDSFPPEHERHIVFRSHCFRLADGAIGASGKLDPKEMLIGDVNYRQLEFENPRCELCEDHGDPIPVEERFYGSKYRPQPK